MLRQHAVHELHGERPLAHRQPDHAFDEEAVRIVRRDLLQLSGLLERLHQQVGVEQGDGQLAPRLVRSCGEA